MAKRTICPACDKPFQVGRAVMFAARTGLRRARVCKRCASGGVLIVQDKSSDEALCVNCGKIDAVFCSLCAVLRSKAGAK